MVRDWSWRGNWRVRFTSFSKVARRYWLVCHVATDFSLRLSQKRRVCPGSIRPYFILQFGASTSGYMEAPAIAPEPITRKDITEIVGDAFKSSASPTSSGTPVPMQSPSTRNERLLTKNDIEKAVKDAVAELTKSNPSNMIGPRTVSAQSDSSSTPPRYLQPAIRSVPPNFSDGQITGEHFGTTVLDVKLHLRVRQSAEDGNYRVGGRVNPGALLGDLGPSNYISLSGNIIKQWSDTNIELKFPADYWSGLWAFVDSKAKGRQIPPPSRSDVQVCYQIRLGDAQNSNELCGQ
jgi:hypothetical protein